MISDDKWHGHGIFDQDCLKCRIAELEAEVATLRERLEIDPRHQTDGIEARDETIRGLEGVIADLRTDRDKVKLLADEWEERYRLCQKLRRDMTNERKTQ